MSYNPTPPLGQATMANSSPVVIASDQSPLPVTVSSGGGSGLTTFHLISANGNNLTSVKATPGAVHGWFIYNNTTTVKKVAFHNTAGTPTAGAGILFSLVIPASSGANVSFPDGIDFSTGIAITTTAGIPDTDVAAVAVNDLTINIFYK